MLWFNAQISRAASTAEREAHNRKQVSHVQTNNYRDLFLSTQMLHLAWQAAYFWQVNDTSCQLCGSLEKNNNIQTLQWHFDG